MFRIFIIIIFTERQRYCCCFTNYRISCLSRRCVKWGKKANTTSTVCDIFAFAVFCSGHATFLLRGFTATLNFQKVKVALNPVRRIFLNFTKSWILSCWLQFDNKRMGSPSSFLSYKRLKLKLRVFLAGHIVAMVTYCATKLTATCSPMIGQFVDTMILASTGIEWL